MAHLKGLTPEELQRRTNRAFYYIKQPEVSPPLDPAAQITGLVCRVNDQWNQDQDTDKKSFLSAIRTMTVIENDDGIVPKGLKLSHEQRAALIVAVSTVLNIDQRDVPGEFSHENHLKELIANRYSSNDDPVGAFQTDLMQEMEKQAQRQYPPQSPPQRGPSGADQVDFVAPPVVL